MPLPDTLARFNRVFTNKLMGPLARVAPGFGVLNHRGRNSGLDYATPLNVFRDDDRLIVALTYGEEVDWLKNARASTSAHLTIRGKSEKVGQPVDISTDEGMAVLPAPVEAVVKALGVTRFVAFPLIE